MKLDMTESMDTLTAPEQKINSNANVNRDTVRALPTATPTDDSLKTVRGERNANRQIFKECIIRLTELSKAEWDRWHPELAPDPAKTNLDNKVHESSNHIKNIKRRYSSRKKKSVDYTNQTNENDCNSDYEPKLPPPPPLFTIRNIRVLTEWPYNKGFYRIKQAKPKMLLHYQTQPKKI